MTVLFEPLPGDSAVLEALGMEFKIAKCGHVALLGARAHVQTMALELATPPARTHQEGCFVAVLRSR
jgi:hypothetical protein